MTPVSERSQISPSEGLKLFSSASIVTVLQDRYQWAVRSFSEGCADWHYNEFIDALVRRATFEPLELNLEKIERRIELGRSDQTSTYGIPYQGDPFLWFLSPLPLAVTLPVETPEGSMRLATGMTADNPVGWVTGNELNLLCTDGDLYTELDRIEDTIVFQRQAIWISEQALELHLQAIARPPGWEGVKI